MDYRSWLMISACILIETAEQSLYRTAARAASKPRWILPAIALHALGLTFWLFLLRTSPLGVVLPLMGANFVAVAIAGRLLFGEPVSLRRWAGIGLIIGGFALVAADLG